MRRTITMREDRVSFRGRTFELVFGVRDYFKLENSRVYKYVITITKGGEYMFRESFSSHYCVLHQGATRIGILCKSTFRKVFFNPDPNRKYHITVKKVRIKRR